MFVPYLPDRVKETCYGSGTGNLTLVGAQSKHLPFSSTAGVKDCPVCIVEHDTTNWELCRGYQQGGSLVRLNVLASSNSNTRVEFASGYKDVFLTNPGAYYNQTLPALLFGGKADGVTDDSRAIVDAIRAGSTASGATVFLHPGVWAISSGVELMSNVRVQLSPGTVVKWTGAVSGDMFYNHQGYPLVRGGLVGHRSIIDCNNLAGRVLHLCLPQFGEFGGFWVQGGREDTTIVRVHCYCSGSVFTSQPSVAEGGVRTASFNNFLPLEVDCPCHTVYEFDGHNQGIITLNNFHAFNASQVYKYGVNMISSFDTNMFSEMCRVSLKSSGAYGAIFNSSTTDRVWSIDVIDGGGYYNDTTAVNFTGGGGTGAAAIAQVSNGIIEAVLLTNPGKGYTSAPSISFGSPGQSGSAVATMGGPNVFTGIYSNTFAQVSVDTFGLGGLGHAIFFNCSHWNTIPLSNAPTAGQGAIGRGASDDDISYYSPIIARDNESEFDHRWYRARLYMDGHTRYTPRIQARGPWVPNLPSSGWAYEFTSEVAPTGTYSDAVVGHRVNVLMSDRFGHHAVGDLYGQHVSVGDGPVWSGSANTYCGVRVDIGNINSTAGAYGFRVGTIPVATPNEKWAAYVLHGEGANNHLRVGGTALARAFVPFHGKSWYWQNQANTTTIVQFGVAAPVASGTASQRRDEDGDWVNYASASTNNVAAGWVPSNYSLTRRDWGPILTAHVKFPSGGVGDPNSRFWCALSSSSPLQRDHMDNMNGVGFLVSSGALGNTNFHVVSNSGTGTTPNLVSTDIPALQGSAYTLRIDCSDSEAVTFWVNETLAGRFTSALPSGQQGISPFLALTNLTAVSRSLALSSLHVDQKA